MTLANLINQLLASDKMSECDHNPLECEVIFRPDFGEGMYAGDMEFLYAHYDRESDLIIVSLKDER